MYNKGEYNVPSTKVPMHKKSKTPPLILILLASLIFIPISHILQVTPANAAQRTLSWSVVETPNNNPGGIIADNYSGINAIALGPDNRTFYAADTANAILYKSIDAGITWYTEIGNRLTTAGAQLPVWNLAISPDDSNFVLAVTGSAASGPKEIFFSGDGGNNWRNTSFPTLAIDEYISCLDISKIYGTSGQVRDIAVGTRSSTVNGRVFNIQFSAATMGSWNNQTASLGNITSIKFSPAYVTDYTITVISTTIAQTLLNFGVHDTSANTTNWNTTAGFTNYPLDIRLTIQGRTIASDNSTLIKSDLELPSDFLASEETSRGCFISLLAESDTAVLYVNSSLSTQPYEITPPETIACLKKFSSIAYTGTQASGILLAGEAPALNSRGLVNVWQCSNAQAATPGAAMWTKSDEIKSPSGGANSGRANAILQWSGDGATSFCCTSSENATLGGTGIFPGQWPFSQLASQLFDESAFSLSMDAGYTWNQIGLINTRIDLLSDIAVMEIPDDPAIEATSMLYLATLKNGPLADNLSSVWRSSGNELGKVWERILLRSTSNNGTILRINPRLEKTEQAGGVVVFADLHTDNITYSADRGQTWQAVNAGAIVNDISLSSDTRMYILEDYDVRQVNRGYSGWTPGPKLNTNLEGNSHTICTPLIGTETSEIVIVGSAFEESSVAWADFSRIIPRFSVLKKLPANGNVHVIADSQFRENAFVYAALNTDDENGTIYRWQIDKSTNWDDLEPPDLDFFGIEMLNDVLYGTWDKYAATGESEGGLDRTLYPRSVVPPHPEWNFLTAGLPDPPSQVHFTREPSSLKISSHEHNTLWAIDNAPYNYDAKTGRLWKYVDSVARLGPWPTSPPTGSFIGADPSSGRGQQIDFKWRPLNDIFAYDLLIAKDVNFTLLITKDANFTLPFGEIENISHVDHLTGLWTITPADQQQPSAWISPGVLEVGRTYYWRVRGSRAISSENTSGETIHSPWSPVMFFSIKPGFIVETSHPGPSLLTPVDGHCSECRSPIRFSWSPVKNATKYEFILSSDPELKNILIKSSTGSTAFEYKDRLEVMKPYYWQVRAISPVISDPSPIGTFSLGNTAVTIPKQPLPGQRSVSAQKPSDFWVWIIIVITMLLMILINLYAFISRRRD